MCTQLTNMIGPDLQGLVLAHEQADAVVVLVAQQLHGAHPPLLPLAAALVIAAEENVSEWRTMSHESCCILSNLRCA